MPTSTEAGNISYIQSELKGGDYDRWLCALFAPSKDRAAIMALCALNVELAKICDVTREPMIALVRLQWWRESLAALHTATSEAEVKDHPVLRALYHAGVRPHEGTLERMLLAREAEQEFAGHATVDALIAHVENTAGALLELCTWQLDAQNDASLALVRHIGIAYGIIGGLRNLRHGLAKGRSTLPLEIMQEAGISMDYYGTVAFKEGVEKLARQVAEVAEAEIVTARGIIKKLRGAEKRRMLPVLLQLSVADFFAARLKASGYKVLTEDYATPKAALTLQLYLRSLLLKF